MTPKEKAQDIYRKMEVDVNDYNSRIPAYSYKQAKECSLVCTEEIIKQWEYIGIYIADMGGKLNPNLEYWYEVKKEINKL